MYAQLKLTALFAVVLLLVSAGFSQAAVDRLALAGEKAFKQATGEAVISDATAGQKEINLKVSGLKPDSVYTLWFVSEEPSMDMAGVGRPDFAFRSDSQGSAEYSAIVAADDIKRWEKLEVAHHPDGNPTNMDNIEIALIGDLDELASGG